MNNRRDFLKKAIGVSVGICSGGIVELIAVGNSGEAVMNKDIINTLIKENGVFPNNGKLPLILYRQAFDISSHGAASAIESTFKKNGWGNNWRNGIYGYHHYHSQAHEFIGVYGGNAEIQFGGPDGVVVKVEKGDAVVIPAGVSHKRIKSSFGFSVVGAYPPGQSPDMKYGKDSERPEADRNIASVELPEKDPVLGSEGPLMKLWKKDKI